MKRISKILAKILLLIISFSQVSTNLYAQPPSISYSTIIGGSGYDYGHAITVDNKGYVYISGQANSSDYPTTNGAYERTHNGSSDILVSKLNQDGSSLVFSTYIGGSDRDDTRKVFIDKSGNIYLTGATSSVNFPTTSNILPGNSSGYFLMLDSNGSSLKYSSRWAGGDKIVMDSDGNLIIAGSTNSETFPTTENAFSRKLAGGNDIFVAKINIKTNTVIFSTLIGGNANDWAPGLVLDSHNNILIAGKTSSENFPVVGNTYGPHTSDKSNVFVTKLKSDGTALIYSAIIGGNDDEWAFDITTDQDDNAYVTGVTKSINFPVSSLAFDTSYNNEEDAFLLKLNSDGTQLIYSTYIGGSLKDGGRGVVVDKTGRAYVTGCTKSTSFPTSNDAYDKIFNGAGTESWAWGDPFLLVMNPDGTQLEYSTYYGGSRDEEAYGIAMDKNRGVYICGITSSNDFPATEGAYDRTLNGSVNSYVVKFQFPEEQYSIDYLGQTPPGDSAVIFAPGVVSLSGRYEYGLTVSPDGNEIFFTEEDPGNGLMVIRKVNKEWGTPEIANLRKNNSWEFEAFFTCDGNKLFFTSDTNSTSKFWYMEKNGDVWEKAKYLESPVNDTPVMWCTFSSDETMYFGNNSNWQIHRAKLINGIYSEIENLGYNGTHPSVAPDESYFLLNSNQYAGYGRNDIFVVFKNGDDNWGTPINLGNKINTSYGETCASLSPDGKFIFFSRYDEPGEKSNIYWISSALIDSIKYSSTGIDKDEIKPDEIKLNQNYPNPFNPSTTISYSLDLPSQIKLTVYNVLGQEIKILRNVFQDAGEHSVVWNATDNNGSLVCSGVYFLKLETDKLSSQKKMILIQ